MTTSALDSNWTRSAPATRIDRSKREHVAQFRRVLWPSSANQSPDESIIVALADDTIAKGKAPLTYFETGITYRFLGKWIESNRGPAFHFDSVVIDEPATPHGLVRYLTAMASNVGEKTAARLVQAYGQDAVKILRENPDRVADDRIMSRDNAREAAADLAKSAAVERTKIDLFGLFSGRGFNSKAITACIKKYGARGPEIIRRNPFKLLVDRIPSAGFKRCDRLYLDMRRPPASLKRQMLCAWNWIRSESSGHTWYPIEDVEKEIRQAVDFAAVNPVRAIILGKRAGWLATKRDDARRLWIADAHKAANEQTVADNVDRLMRCHSYYSWPDDLPVSQAEGDGLPSVHQRTEALKAIGGRVGILAGVPGSGKTHTLSFILRDVIARVGISNVAACAPTGKAAVRATQSLASRGLNLRAKTIHSLLQILEGGYGGEPWKFAYNRSNPLPFRVVIVDESSMIDTDLMASLLSACADGTLVLFIGDPYQLPPVGPGAPLRDLIAAGVPCGELSEVRRNAGMIVHACKSIKDGRQFETTSRVDLDAGANLLLLDTAAEADIEERLIGVLSNMTKFHPVAETQVIVGLNKKGGLSREKINDKLHGLLNPSGRAVDGCPFRVGDKIICLRNNRMKVVEEPPAFMAADQTDAKTWTDARDEHGDSIEAYIANGEIGYVLAIASNQAVARMGDAETAVTIRIPIGKQGKSADDDDSGEGGSAGGTVADDAERGKGCSFDLAYAITVHKSQGSESPCIIAVVDPKAGTIADRHFWYTALSRASKLCIVIGSFGVMSKQCKKVSLVKRKTFLRELLEAAMLRPPLVDVATDAPETIVEGDE